MGLFKQYSPREVTHIFVVIAQCSLCFRADQPLYVALINMNHKPRKPKSHLLVASVITRSMCSSLCVPPVHVSSRVDVVRSMFIHHKLYYRVLFLFQSRVDVVHYPPEARCLSALLPLSHTATM